MKESVFLLGYMYRFSIILCPRIVENPKSVSDCTVKHHSLLHRWVTEKDHIATRLWLVVLQQILSFQKVVWVLFLLLSKAVAVIPAVHMHC